MDCGAKPTTPEPETSRAAICPAIAVPCPKESFRPSPDSTRSTPGSTASLKCALPAATPESTSATRTFPRESSSASFIPRKEYAEGAWASHLSTPIWQGSSGAFEGPFPALGCECSFSEALWVLSGVGVSALAAGIVVLAKRASTAQDPRRAFLTRVTEHPPFPMRRSR